MTIDVMSWLLWIFQEKVRQEAIPVEALLLWCKWSIRGILINMFLILTTNILTCSWFQLKHPAVSYYMSGTSIEYLNRNHIKQTYHQNLTFPEDIKKPLRTDSILEPFNFQFPYGLEYFWLSLLHQYCCFKMIIIF